MGACAAALTRRAAAEASAELVLTAAPASLAAHRARSSERRVHDLARDLFVPFAASILPATVLLLALGW